MTERERPTAPKTVLLVEDDVDSRELYATTLREEGYRVIEAPTIKDAEDAIRGFLPDVVVLDCMLPDGDGMALLSRWRDPTMGRVPVIVVTAHGERQHIEAATLAGADLFVPKPCPGNTLAAYVHRALSTAAPTRGGRGAAL